MFPKFSGFYFPVFACLCALVACYSLTAVAADSSKLPEAAAASESEMKPYAEVIDQTNVKIEMVPIPGGSFLMGSPADEQDRLEDEGPQHEVRLEPFWMGKHEIAWEAYEVWGDELDILRRKIMGKKKTERDGAADAVTRPTEPYTDMSFGMGKGRFPAISMTQHAARKYCHWLSAKTGRYYRLPTEAEWEYACRAGTKTAYHFGDDPAELSDYAWYEANSDETSHKVGLKRANPWGLHDMHGSVAEWVLDQYLPDFYGQKATRSPLAIPTQLYPRVARGGGWEDEASALRSAARVGSSEDWKEQDPQLPQSIWYHTDAQGLGFRIVRPLVEPSEEEKASKWEKTDPKQLDPDEE